MEIPKREGVAEGAWTGRSLQVQVQHVDSTCLLHANLSSLFLQQIRRHLQMHSVHLPSTRDLYVFGGMLVTNDAGPRYGPSGDGTQDRYGYA
jgi:hypothetical protein